MRRRDADVLIAIAALLLFFFFVPVLGTSQYQSASAACASASSKEASQAEPEPFEPCRVPEFGSVTYSVFGAGGVWMEDEYVHYYSFCIGTSTCS